MQVRTAVVLLVAAVLGTKRGAASTCAVSASWSFAPTPLQAAPLNTHFWAFGPRTLRPADCPPNEKHLCRERAYRFRMLSAPKGRVGGRAVPVEVRRSETKSSTIFELIPKANLEPNTRYEVWLLADGEHYPRRLSGTFRTGSELDVTPPTWSGLTHANWPPPPPPPHPSNVAFVGGPSAIPVFGAPAEDRPSSGWLHYAIWVVTPGQTVDYTKPPTTFVNRARKPLQIAGRSPAPAPLLELGSGDCDDSRFVIPHDKPAIRIGVRAVDLAGNRSASSELTIKLK